MTIIEELERLLHEHQDLTAMVNGQLLAKDLRELVGRYKGDAANQQAERDARIMDVIKHWQFGIIKEDAMIQQIRDIMEGK